MYELKHLENFAKTGDLLEIQLTKLNDNWLLTFDTSTIEGFALHTANGEKIRFATLDAAAEVAKDLRDLAHYEGYDLVVSVDWL